VFDATVAPATTAGSPPTTEPARCVELTDEYLDVFFALGAGTPQDPEATTVRLPLGQLQAVVQDARRLGCPRFVEVACSAYAELAAQGLTATNADPPDAC
jgi:hypothetical protein